MVFQGWYTLCSEHTQPVESSAAKLKLTIVQILLKWILFTLTISLPKGQAVFSQPELFLLSLAFPKVTVSLDPYITNSDLFANYLIFFFFLNNKSMWKVLDLILAHDKSINVESLTLHMAGLGGYLDSPDLVCMYIVYISIFMGRREDIRAQYSV